MDQNPENEPISPVSPATPEPTSPEPEITPEPESTPEPTLEPEPAQEPTPSPESPAETPEPAPTPEPISTPEQPTPAQSISSEPVVPDSIVSPEKKSKKGLIIGCLLVLLLAAAGGLAAYWYFVLKPATTSAPQASQETSPAETAPASAAEETEITDPTIISNLFNRILTIHYPGVDGYLSSIKESGTSYEQNRAFNFATSYSVSGKLYAKGLENKDRLSVVTRYLRAKGEFEPIKNFDIPSDFYATKYAEYCKTSTIDPLCTGESGSAISAEKVLATYREFFADEPSLEAPTAICGAPGYDETYKIFFENIAGCGGVDLINHQIYIWKYSEDDEKAYVYASVNTIAEDNGADASGNFIGKLVYKSFLDHDAFYDSATQTTLTPDESLVYGRTDPAAGSKYSIQITSENYADFDQYRFVFVKTDNNQYLFSASEKL